MRTIGAVAAAIALLAGCSTAHHDTRDPRARYLESVRHVLHTSNHAGDAQMVRYGHYVCAAFAKGGTWSEQIAATTTPDVRPTQAAQLITAATVAFCPQYRDKLPLG